MMNIRQYETVDSFLAAVHNAIQIEWAVAHESPTVEDWRHRWNNVESMLSGMHNMTIFVFGLRNEEYDEVDQAITLLRRIAGRHALEHLL